MSEIKEIYAREVLDSRGNPTIDTGANKRRCVWTGDCAKRCVNGNLSGGRTEG